MNDNQRIGGLEPLARPECLALLAACVVGRVGVVVAGRPHVLPVNYVLAGEATVVFRTSPGSLLSRVVDGPAVFEIDGFDAVRRAGWSVCLHGRGTSALPAPTDGAGDPRRQLISWAPGDRAHWCAIVADEITGRRIPLSAAAADLGGWMPGVF